MSLIENNSAIFIAVFIVVIAMIGSYLFNLTRPSVPGIDELQCPCGKKMATECSYMWGPDCSLGNDPKHAQKATQVYDLDKKLDLVELPKIRVSKQAYSVMSQIAQQRGINIQALVREKLEPGELGN